MQWTILISLVVGIAMLSVDLQAIRRSQYQLAQAVAAGEQRHKETLTKLAEIYEEVVVNRYASDDPWVVSLLSGKPKVDRDLVFELEHLSQIARAEERSNPENGRPRIPSTPAALREWERTVRVIHEMRPDLRFPEILP